MTCRRMAPTPNLHRRSTPAVCKRWLQHPFRHWNEISVLPSTAIGSFPWLCSRRHLTVKTEDNARGEDSGNPQSPPSQRGNIWAYAGLGRSSYGTASTMYIILNRQYRWRQINCAAGASIEYTHRLSQAILNQTSITSL